MCETSQYVIPAHTEVILLDCQEAFENLSEKEKLYAHYLAQASFKGGLIVLFQTSPEAPGIFLLLQQLFRAQSPHEVSKLALSIGFNNDDVEAFHMYVAAFYANMGNYQSFGDTKFIPDVHKLSMLTGDDDVAEDNDDVVDENDNDVDDDDDVIECRVNLSSYSKFTFVVIFI
ncbi:bifunctional diacylglycerol diphosphate phosphatase/phosphatidate phosphatase [Bulinus truncatus]|nr:bifunctional diacylglycerol diphosphate phosphatase/phosphatidate phosphatase [Bulinus truncatus]